MGPGPNLVFMQIYQENTGQTIGFTQWMSWGVPVVVLFVPVIGLWLTRNLHGASGVVLPEVGAWRPEEKRVMAVFALTGHASAREVIYDLGEPTIVGNAAEMTLGLEFIPGVVAETAAEAMS